MITRLKSFFKKDIVSSGLNNVLDFFLPMIKSLLVNGFDQLAKIAEEAAYYAERNGKKGEKARLAYDYAKEEIKKLHLSFDQSQIETAILAAYHKFIK